MNQRDRNLLLLLAILAVAGAFVLFMLNYTDAWRSLR